MLKKYSSYLWLAAFLCGLFFVNAWQLQLLGVAVLIVYFWAVVMLAPEGSRGWDVPKSWTLLWMALFWLLTLLSVFHSAIFNVSFMAFCYFSVLPLTFLVFSIRGTEKQFTQVLKVSAVIYAGLSFWALLQFFVFGEYFQGRAHHPLINPNSLAALLSLGFFCALGWMLGAQKRLQSNSALLLCILIFGGIVSTGSRGALFAMIPVMIMFFVVMRDQARVHWRCLGILGVSCAALFCLTIFGVIHNDTLIARVSDTVALNLKDITSNRDSLWLATIAMIKAHGFWGTGIGTYFLYFPEFRLADDNWGAYYAHSDPLQFWAELGVLGPVLFYAFIISVVIRTWQALNRAKDVTQRLQVFVPFCALGAMVIHTHVTFNLYNFSILFVSGFLSAAWFWATQNILKTDIKEITFPEKYSPATKVVAIAMPFVFIAILFSAYIYSEHLTNKARDHMLQGDLEDFAEEVVQASRISFDGNYRIYLLAVNVPLSLLEGARDELTVEQKKEIFDQALSYLRHVRAINPRSSSALYYLAKIQENVPADFIPEDLTSPEEYYKAALKLDPLHLGARIELSEIYAQQGKKEESLKVLEQGINYRYSTSKAMEYYARLMKIYVQSGNEAGRQKMAKLMRGFQSRLRESQRDKSRPLYNYLWGN